MPVAQKSTEVWVRVTPLIIQIIRFTQSSVYSHWYSKKAAFKMSSNPLKNGGIPREKMRVPVPAGAGVSGARLHPDVRSAGGMMETARVFTGGGSVWHGMMRSVWQWSRTLSVLQHTTRDGETPSNSDLTGERGHLHHSGTSKSHLKWF